MECLRAQLVHRLPLLEEPRMLIGDSTAGQISTEMTAAAVLATTENDGLAGIVRQVSASIWSSKVRAALLILGRDALIAGESMGTMREYLERLRELCLQYPHVRLVWAIPPYVHTRAAAYGQLLELLEEITTGTRIELAFYTRQGRSLAEVYQYGGTHNGANVNQTGILTHSGIKAVLAWLYNVMQFPGERELGQV